MRRTVILLVIAGFMLGVGGGMPDHSKGTERESLSSNGISFRYPFAFFDRFPGNAYHLGFKKGPGVGFQVGAMVYPGDAPLTSVTASNLNTGVKVEMESVSLPIKPGMWSYSAPWSPEDHRGIWEIMAKDEAGNEATVETHELDMDAVMPFVKEMRASGDPLAPTISWRPPKDKDMEDIPEECRLSYVVRLLKAADNQFWQSGGTTSLSVTIPEGVLETEDLFDTWVRIEFRCFDERDYGDFTPPYWVLPLELRSETFRPLYDLIYEADN